jgi:CheY-like chemotaxis protein
MRTSRRFLEGVRILIVEDNTDIRLLIVAFLDRHDAQVSAAKDAIEALRLVREIRPGACATAIRHQLTKPARMRSCRARLRSSM